MITKVDLVWVHRSLALALLLSLGGPAVADDSVMGRWRTIDDATGEPKSIVEIYRQNEKLYGKVAKLFRSPEQDQDPVCDKCEGALKGQQILGMVIIDGLTFTDDAWSGGTILDPAKGKTYKAKLWRDGATLKVRGYLGILFRTQTWLAE